MRERIFCQDLQPHRGPTLEQSVSEGLQLWKGPMLEQFLKNCGPWEGPTLENFVKDCLLSNFRFVLKSLYPTLLLIGNK